MMCWDVILSILLTLSVSLSLPLFSLSLSHAHSLSLTLSLYYSLIFFLFTHFVHLFSHLLYSPYLSLLLSHLNFPVFPIFTSPFFFNPLLPPFLFIPLHFFSLFLSHLSLHYSTIFFPSFQHGGGDLIWTRTADQQLRIEWYLYRVASVSASIIMIETCICICTCTCTHLSTCIRTCICTRICTCTCHLIPV